MESDKSELVKVVSLGYEKQLLQESKNQAASDGANRRMVFASRIKTYTMVSLCRPPGFEEKTQGNIHVIPAVAKFTPLGMWRMYKTTASLCKQNKINVIQTQEPSTTGLIGFWLKKKFKLPICICVYGPNPWDEHWRKSSLYNRIISPLAKRALQQADRIIADGTLTIESLKRAGIPEERLTRKVNVPSNITSFAKTDGQPLRSELLGNNGKQLLLHVGNMTLQKNVPFLLKAFLGISKQFPDALLVVVGKGKRAKKYHQMATKLGLDSKVIWAGAVPHQEIPTYFRACDVCLMTSRFEGFPRVFVEAASSGRPVVTTLVSGCNDGVVDNQNGFIVAQGDMDSYVQRVCQLLSDPEKCQTMGQTGQSMMQELAAKRESYNHLQVDVWSQILASHEAGEANVN